MNISPNKTAMFATLHCLTGCAVGEVLGMVFTTAFQWSNFASIILSIVMAFVFGYTFSTVPLVRSGLSIKKAFSLALAADTVSIAVMELSDNAFVMAVPGAMNAGLTTSLFWISMALSLIVAFLAAFPVNKYLISKDMGHAVVHKYHHQHHEHMHHAEES